MGARLVNAAGWPPAADHQTSYGYHIISFCRPGIRVRAVTAVGSDHTGLVDAGLLSDDDNAGSVSACGQRRSTLTWFLFLAGDAVG